MSLIMEGLKRAQHLRTGSLGNVPASGSHPRPPGGYAPVRKKPWLFGAAGIIGLVILVLFFGGVLSAPDTGSSRSSAASSPEANLLSLRPEEPRQPPARPSEKPQAFGAKPKQKIEQMDGRTAPQVGRIPEKFPAPPHPSGSSSAGEIPETGRKEDQAVKPQAESGGKEGVFASVSRSEERAEPRSDPRDMPPDLPAVRPDGRPGAGSEGRPPVRDSGEISSSVHPEAREHQARIAAAIPVSNPVPPPKAEPPLNEPSPSAYGKSPTESPSPAAEKINSRPIEVKGEKTEKSRALSSTSEALRQFNHAVALHQRRETAGAIEAYRKAIELNPASVEAYNNLGLLFQELGDMERAEWTYRKAIEIAPGYVKAYNNLGVLFLVRGREDEATDLFQKALAVDPGHYESHLHLGVLYRRRGQTHRAIESYQRALSIQPLQAEAYYNLGLLYEELDNVESAVRYYQKFTQMASDTYPDLVSKVRRHVSRLMKKQSEKKGG